MNEKFKPNERGLVVVTLLKNYASNVAGERAGFLPEIARDLVQKGYAKLPGDIAVTVALAEAAPELTTRKFKPETPPVDAEIEALRAEYKAITGGKDADARWKKPRLEAEIKKAEDAAAAAAQAPEGEDAGETGETAGEQSDEAENG